MIELLKEKSRTAKVIQTSNVTWKVSKLEFFWSLFARLFLLRKSSYSVQMWESTKQKLIRIWRLIKKCKLKINPLRANPTKLSNTLKQFVSYCENKIISFNLVTVSTFPKPNEAALSNDVSTKIVRANAETFVPFSCLQWKCHFWYLSARF